MLTSLLGHYNNFFYAALLLDIAMGVKTLRTILSSVTHNGKQVSALTATTTHGEAFCPRRANVPSLAADDDGGFAGRGGVPVHRGGV